MRQEDMCGSVVSPPQAAWTGCRRVATERRPSLQPRLWNDWPPSRGGTFSGQAPFDVTLPVFPPATVIAYGRVRLPPSPAAPAATLLSCPSSSPPARPLWRGSVVSFSSPALCRVRKNVHVLFMETRPRGQASQEAPPGPIPQPRCARAGGYAPPSEADLRPEPPREPRPGPRAGLTVDKPRPSSVQT